MCYNIVSHDTCCNSVLFRSNILWGGGVNIWYCMIYLNIALGESDHICLAANGESHEPVCAHAHPVPFLCDTCVCTGQLISGARQILLVQVELFLSLSKTRLRLPAALFFQLQLLRQPGDTYTQSCESERKKNRCTYLTGINE